MEEPQGPAANPSPPNVGAHRRILLVDDDPVVLRAFEGKLRADGFVVSSTPDPSSVASLVEKAKPEVVILDMHFPPQGAMDWSGFTVIRWLRRMSAVATIPLIVVSGTEQPELREECLAIGATAFFAKPVRYKELLAGILAVLSPKA